MALWRAFLLVIGLCWAACSDGEGQLDAGPGPDTGLAREASAPDMVARDSKPPGDSGDANLADTSPPKDSATPDAKSCAPAPPASTLHLFTKLEADLKTITGSAARKARVDAFFTAVDAAGGVPVRDSSFVVFAVQATVPAPLSVAGTFNGWKKGADVMAKLSGTNLYYLKKKLGPARQEYKYVDGKGTWHKDPNNRHVTWDGIPVAGLGKFNSVIPPWSGVQAKGRLEWLRVASPQLSNTRDVFVYLPPDHDNNTCKRFPVLLVNDGNESIARSHLDQVAAATFAAKKASPAILVFVALASQNDRMSEYSCSAKSKGPKYADFLCDTLAKVVDKRYRTKATAASRGIIGASMGGLISFAAAFWRDDCLGLAGSQSGSFWFDSDAMIKRVTATSPKVKLLRAYLDNGTDNRKCTLDMRDALKAKKYPTYHWENLKQKHTWPAWQDRFDEALGYMFPP